MSKDKKSFITGAAILGIAGILIKVIGALFRIPLGNILSEDATSYYQSAYPFYNTFLVISTAGLPAAIAKIVSANDAVGNYEGNDRVFTVMRKFMFVIGFVGSLIMFFGAEFLSAAINNPGSLNSFRALSFALLFVSVMSAYRGYFQGLRDLRPYAVSQIIEQIVRVSGGLFLAIFLLQYSDEFAAAGATFGATFGSLAGLILLIFLYKGYRKRREEKVTDGEFPFESNSEIIKKIMTIAIPITLGASVVPLLNLIDATIVMRKLEMIGFGDKANDMYSYLAFYAVSIINFPQVVITAIQLSLLPAVSHLLALGDMEELSKTIKSGIKLALFIGGPAAVGIFVLAKQIISLLYPSKPEVIMFTPEVLRILGVGVIFLALFQSTTGILQGMGKQLLPARNLFIGAVLKVVFCYILVGIPALNIKGAAISTLIAYSVAAMLNMYTLKENIKLDKDILVIIGKTLISSGGMGLAVYATNKLLAGFISPSINTLLSVMVGVLSYVVIVFAIRTFNEDDLELMPGSNIMRRIMKVFP